jgi:hypothetical protein
MRMPSLIKYFAVVGSVLLGLLFVVNQIAGSPGTDGKTQASGPAPKVAVQHDPRASAVERWRNELAAMRAAEQTPTGDNASIAAKSAPEPQQPAAQPAQVAAALPVSEATPASLTTTPDDEAAKLAVQKVKAAKTKAAKAKVARERAAVARLAAGDGGVPVAGHYGAARERTASNQQDQYYYGQRSASAQPAQAPGSAYAPRPSYGPFGSGRGW